MSDDDNTMEDFIKGFINLKDSLQEKPVGEYFNKEIVLKNIDLVRKGRYAIVDQIWKIDKESNHEYARELLGLMQLFAEEYKEDITKMRNRFEKDDSFSEKFLIDVLTNKHRNIYDFILSERLSDDFVIFYAIFLAYPYRNRVAQIILTEFDLSSHMSGFCPVCGHWPGISYIIEKEGTKIMSCVCCGAHWSFRRLICSFCFNTDKDTLGYLNIKGEDKISAYICDKCRRYLKTIRIKEGEIDFSKELSIIDYMGSGFLDIAAMQNKYLQEPILSTRFENPNDSNIESYLKELKL